MYVGGEKERGERGGRCTVKQDNLLLALFSCVGANQTAKTTCTCTYTSLEHSYFENELSLWQQTVITTVQPIFTIIDGV